MKKKVNYNFDLNIVKKSLKSVEAQKLFDKFVQFTQKKSALEKTCMLSGDELENELKVWERNRIKASSLEASKALEYDVDDFRVLTWKEYRQWIDDTKKLVELLEENRQTLFNEERARRQKAVSELD